jgi:hypothetical protein
MVSGLFEKKRDAILLHLKHCISAFKHLVILANIKLV